MMLPGESIPDAIRAGLGLAARAAGDWCDLYRPADTLDPLAPGSRLLRLPAVFVSVQGADKPVRFGESLWQGIFDAGYTRAGDYLRGADGTFFIVSQMRLGPIECVRCNRTLSVARAPGPQLAGLNRYGGVQKQTATPLLRNWPASVLTFSRDSGRGALPGDAPGLPGGAGGWEVLLPVSAEVVLRTGDLLEDDIGRNGVVASTELSALGWRLFVRQAAS
jgi:hypothetical protein